ncbi:MULTISPECIES: hypothetical protein [unclassified Breznakia]|uniref:hypothetical protein n=1 Tax=unclassified Breznakia TaxID=2623764 RepID=UPI0024766C65|nr:MULTISPECIES: hypothetical protein [unclassified Breznakia]MDH6366900.1 hypothetical protein [Breznakia sp. PH1-1]MDH6404078.1 hypothetical protein [Breznakia sp. PF1-11]MDH6411700.1 hypothetical protein [Breznakia sp. PFB1-11]MDH6414066.1 hypothetical protein [Breznakia sp. PFB1-14]MDH6416496.1 hypothetical protein [Breznakia sp. PFB1-4]
MRKIQQQESNISSGFLTIESGAYSVIGTSSAMMEKLALFIIELSIRNLDSINDDEIIKLWKDIHKLPLVYKIK